MRDTIAIVGSHPRTREEFNFDRSDCDVWVFNEAMSQGWVKRADAVFQLHRREIWSNPANRNDANHAAWLRSGDTPEVIMQEHYDEVPKSTRYPLDEICEKYLVNLSVSIGNKRYFTSSIAYAIALALYRGYKRIELYGVEMETQTEYMYQRDGVTFWIGIAMASGVECDIHSSLFDAPQYGYHGEVTLEYSQFVERMEELGRHIEPLKADYNAKQRAAVDAYHHYEITGENPQAIPDTIQAQIMAGNKLAEVDGAYQEMKRYIGKADTMRDESGGTFLFSRQEFEQAAQALMIRREQSVTNANTGAGACQVAFNEAAKIKNTMKRRKKLQEFGKIASQYIAHSLDVGLVTGAYRENMQMLQILDKYIKAAGGVKAEEVLLAAGGQHGRN